MSVFMNLFQHYVGKWDFIIDPKFKINPVFGTIDHIG